ncbi:unnamed protein product [Orchesella dallaii]|uniref:SCP domain-containing protein n=1 Tax=Orchesella dallaii TaxID=48710 RepID=A0ABP1QTG8_9HEXA
MGNRIVFIIATVLAGVCNILALSEIDFGMGMSIRAYDSICWFEKLKRFPQTDSKGYLQECYGKAENVKSQLKGDDMAKKYFGDWMIQLAMRRLPSEYGQRCNTYLQNPSVPFASSLRNVLNDGQNGAFPFQGFAYCLLNVLREKYGEQATTAVANEKTVSGKYWINVMLDRDNEFRARHSSPPLQLVTELNNQAQTWAETMASKCQMYHSQNSDPGRQWRGQGTGENLASGGGNLSKEDAAYIASNGWYEEIRDYPFPKGFTGGQDFYKVGHFTQTVWKSTQYVGYGFGYNPNCPSTKWYIAARYAAPGNMEGRYQENVLPPRF